MGEWVGLDLYCGTAEEALEFSAHRGAAAKMRAIRNLPKGYKLRRLEIVPVFEADELTDLHSAAASAADLLVRACVRCRWGLVDPERAESVCPIIIEFKELEAGTMAKIAQMRSE